MAKFDLVGHMLSLAGKCLVNGYYHKPCIYTQKFQKISQILCAHKPYILMSGH